MRVLFQETVAPKDWDVRLIAAGQAAGLCQTTFWARVIERVDHAQPIFVEVCSDRSTLPVLSLLLFRKLAWDRHRQRRDFVAAISTGWSNWLEWIDGPVVHSASDSDVIDAFETLLEWVCERARIDRLSGIRALGIAHTSHWAGDRRLEALFASRGFVPSRWGTFLSDLTRDESVLWRSIDHGARKSVNKARAMGARVVPITSFEEYATRFDAPYRTVEIAAGRSPNPKSVAETMWREDRDGYYRYYIAASPEGETLATLGMYMFNGVATETSSALTAQAYSQKIPAQDLLHWEMMLEAKRAGCHTFDLAGVSPSPADSKGEGIRRFKQKWGGVYSEYNRFDLGQTGALVSLRDALRNKLDQFRGWRQNRRFAVRTRGYQN
jgi:hypothetical protein